MGIYFSQTFTVSGPQEDFARFLDQCLKKDEANHPISIDFEKIAPIPEGLPDGSSSGPLGLDVDLGVETINREPRPRLLEGVSYPRPSVLASVQAKKWELTNYDRLLQWVQKNRPSALAIGQAAIRAHAELGSWTRQEWQFDNWGESVLEDFAIESLSDSAITIRFYTKGLPIGPIMRRMGQRFPSLDFRLAALDDGCDFPYVATSSRGEFAEEYAEATDEFVKEVEGRPREIDAFYTTPSVIQPWPMTNIRFWAAERKVTKALADYPVYEPPFVGLCSTLSSAQAQANFEKFMNTRGSRIERLRSFLEKFNVALETSDAGLRRLDRWIAKYGAFLSVRESGSSFLTHIPAWRNSRLGQNVIFDLATFLGEVMIQRNPGFDWELYRQVPSGLRKGSELHQALVIRGPNPDAPWRIWPFRRVPEACRALREKSFMWQKPRRTISPPEAVDKFASYILAEAAERGLQALI